MTAPATHDIDAERFTLGAMLVSQTAIERVLSLGVTTSMFTRTAHQLVFDAIVELHEKEAVDEYTVHKMLQHQGRSDEAGGFVGVSELADRVPAVANVRAYAEAVVDAATRRVVLSAAQQLADLAQDPESDTSSLESVARLRLDETLDSIRSTHSAGSIVTLSEALVEAYDEMSERAERGVAFAGLSTGFDALDARWGGVQKGRFIVIAGRPGMGKSALGSGIAESIVFGSGENVLIFNLEMPIREQGERVIARHGGLDLNRIANTQPSDEEFSAAYDVIAKLDPFASRMLLDTTPTLSIDDVCSRARRTQRDLQRTGQRLGMVLVDYLQKLSRRKGQDEYDAVSDASGKLKALALELQAPVIALAQLNRSVEAREDKIPNMSDLRGSGAIEQDADIIALLCRPEYYAKEQTPREWRGVARCETAKARTGKPGVDKLRWEGRFTRFENYREEFNAGIDRGIA